MEIERKFLLKEIPVDLSRCDFHLITQAYLNTNPVIRIRRQDDEYYMTYKGKGLLAREEYNLPLNKESFEHLLPKADGNIISKKRYLIPLTKADINADCFALLQGETLTIELDEFAPPFAPLLLAEIEFPSVEAANAFQMPDYFSEDVTENVLYHNSNMSSRTIAFEKK